jgi:hypothetical protein
VDSNSQGDTEMTDINDDEEAYLIMPEGYTKKLIPAETVWAKIGDKGDLEILRWDLIEMYANEYNSSEQNRTQTHIMCKLLVLVREQTRKECNEAR